MPACVVNVKGTLFLNGTPPGKALALKRAMNTRVYCADGALSYLHDYGITPAVIVGDFDSVDKTLLSLPIYKNAKIVPLQPRKNDTDFAVAAQTAIEEGITDLCILGGLGGREDHLYGNLCVLYSLSQQGTAAFLESETRQIRIITGKYVFKACKGMLFSTLPFGGNAEIQNAYGLAYDANKPFIQSETLGISNIVGEDDAGFTVTKGAILLFTHE